MQKPALLLLRLAISTIGAFGVALLLGRIQLFPDTSRRMEILFLLAFGLVLFLWSLVDALIVLRRARRARRQRKNPPKGGAKYLFRQIPAKRRRD